jgi:hypothetical protein
MDGLRNFLSPWNIKPRRLERKKRASEPRTDPINIEEDLRIDDSKRLTSRNERTAWHPPKQ